MSIISTISSIITSIRIIIATGAGAWGSQGFRGWGVAALDCGGKAQGPALKEGVGLGFRDLGFRG